MEKVILANEYGRVADISEATLVVAENGPALLDFINSLGDEEHKGDYDWMNSVEQELYDVVDKDDHLKTWSWPVGVQFAYRQFGVSEEYIPLTDVMAEAIWAGRDKIRD
jgi:hypothetical protein